MKRWGNYLVEVSYWAALVFLWAGASALFALLCGLFSFTDLQAFMGKLWGMGIIYAFASVYLLIGLYFILLIARLRGQRGWFVREGPGGQIQISPVAIRDLVSQTLRQELGLPRFQIKLEHAGEGVRVRIIAGLAPGQEVSATGERVQQLLRQRITEQVGVPVTEVVFLTKNIVAQPSTPRGVGPATEELESKDSEGGHR